MGQSSDSTPSVIAALRDPLFECLASATNSVALCSPYIGSDTAEMMSALARDAAASWKLLTFLDPAAAASRALSLDGLRMMISAGIAIRNIPSLHAKFFLIDDEIGFLGSANLTAPGLGTGRHRNLEMTAILTPSQRSEASEILSNWWKKSEHVTEDMINDCEDEAGRIMVQIPLADLPSDGGGASDDSVYLPFEDGIRRELTVHSVFGRQIEDGMYRREGRSKGKAYLVVCTNGDFWYVDEDRAKHDSPTRQQIDELYNERHRRTKVVRFAEPPR